MYDHMNACSASAASRLRGKQTMNKKSLMSQQHFLSIALWIVIAGLPLSATAAPVNYTIQPGHTYPSFEAPHKGISWWRGKFNHSQGKVTLDREARTGTVEIVVDTSSVDFGHGALNEVALGPDFFNVAKYPNAVYRGTIIFNGDTPARLDGQFTLLGITRPLQLKINSFKCIAPPKRNGEICGADAEAEFNRSDFGMTREGTGEEGIVKLRIQVEASRDD